RAPAKIAHRRKDLLDGGFDAIDGELDGGGQIGNAGFQDWTQELALRYGAVLEDLDGASLSAARCSAPVSAWGSRTLAAKPRALSPTALRSAAKASSRSWFREISAMSDPSGPNFLATAPPNPGPAPTMAMVVIDPFRFGLGAEVSMEMGALVDRRTDDACDQRTTHITGLRGYRAAGAAPAVGGYFVTPSRRWGAPGPPPTTTWA